MPYTDVWDFPTVPTHCGKYPCEKPLALMEHIIRTSSRPGDVVLDCFAGSGTTLLAAVKLGRKAIGIEQVEHWVRYAEARIKAALAQPDMVNIAMGGGA